MPELTPYDRGERLEAHVWVHGQTTSPEGRARGASEVDFGRVDFDNEEGTTITTLVISRSEHGYEMRIDQHSDDYLRVLGAQQPPNLEPEAYEMDEEHRTRQMMLLDEGLHEVGREYAEHVFFYDDGDIFAFDPGNYVFLPASGPNGSCFAIEERYARGTDWEDDERVPIGWDWVEKGPALMPDGTTQMRIQAEGTTLPSDIERLIDRARTWAREHSERVAAEEAAERELFQARLREGRGRSI